ncbi:MAG: glutaredoxin family protein [Gemmataceae bacterium]|nr:glutaredoxin family protein [Gemmataceae bacterium]MDW8266512.1 glutaredoxin family protein [Gemmataceae bacterium]
MWRRQKPCSAGTRSPRHVVLYTRAGCHLCESALRLLQAEQTRCPFTLEIVDVDSQADLAAEHGESVPVVAIDGRVRFRGQVNPVLLRRVFRD